MSDAGLFSGTVGLLILLFLVVLAILWFVLPFAVFGIKARLDTLIEEQRKTNAVLANTFHQVSDIKDAVTESSKTQQ